MTDGQLVGFAFIVGMFAGLGVIQVSEKIGRWMDRRRTPAAPRSRWETHP